VKRIIVWLMIILMAANVFSVADAPGEAVEPAAPAEGTEKGPRIVETAPLWEDGPQVWKKDIPGYYEDWDNEKSFDENYESVEQLDPRIKKIEGDSQGFAFDDAQYYYTRDGLKVKINGDFFEVNTDDGKMVIIPKDTASFSRTSKGFTLTDSEGQAIGNLNGKGFSFVDAQGQESARIPVERFNEILTADELANDNFDQAKKMAIAVANAADRAGQDLNDYEFDENKNQWSLGNTGSIKVGDDLMVTLELTQDGQTTTTWSTPEGNTVREIRADGELTGYNVGGNALDKSFGENFLKENGDVSASKVDELSAFTKALEETEMYDFEDLKLGAKKGNKIPLLENGDQIGDITLDDEGNVLRREASWQERIQGGNFITWVANQGSEIETYTYVVGGRPVTVDSRTKGRFDAAGLDNTQGGNAALAAQAADISEFENLKKDNDGNIFFEQTTSWLNVFEQETWSMVVTPDGDSYLIEADSIDSENLNMENLGLDEGITSTNYDQLKENQNIKDFNGIRKVEDGRITESGQKSGNNFYHREYNADGSFQSTTERVGMSITWQRDKDGKTTALIVENVEGLDDGTYTEDEFEEAVEAAELSEGAEDFIEESEQNDLNTRREKDRGGKSWVGFRASWLLLAYKPMHETGNLLYGKAKWYNDWIEEVDKFFAQNYLGTEYWASEVCRSEYFKYPETDVFVETPTGLAQFGGHVEATVSEPVPIICNTRIFCQSKTANSDAECIGNICRIPTGSCSTQADCGEKELCHEGKCKKQEERYFYKITWGVRAPQDSELTPEKEGEEAVNFNIMIKSPARTAVLFDGFISLNNGEVSNNLVADYAVHKYDEICIVYGDKYPVTFRPGEHPPQKSIHKHCSPIKTALEDWGNWRASGQDENTGTSAPNYLPGWTG